MGVRQIAEMSGRGCSIKEIYAEVKGGMGDLIERNGLAYRNDGNER